MLKWFFLFSLLVAGCSVSQRFIAFGSDPSLKILAAQAKRNDQPFTGVAVFLYPNWKLHRIVPFWNGSKHGTEVHWYGNGQRWEERSYRNGLDHGIQRGWYANGEIRFLRPYTNGQPHGEYWAWHPNGQVSNFTKFDHGKELAVKSWSSFGAIHYNYLFKGNERVGVQGGKYCRTKNLKGS